VALLSYLRKLRRLPSLIRRWRHILPEQLNDDFWWDAYAREWDSSEKSRGLRYLGNEWTGEEGFLSLLEKRSSPQFEALEIGCGGGRITAAGVRLFKHVSAADISKEMLRKCRESIRGEANVSFHKLDGFTLKEFADESMDFVYAHDVFVHFSSLQVYPYLREIKRVLRNQGIGLISFFDFVNQFRLFKEASLGFWSRRRFPTHMRLHFLTEEMLRTMLSDLDLHLLEIHRDEYLILTFRK
jgi:SAM-dependent methyltransferase